MSLQFSAYLKKVISDFNPTAKEYKTKYARYCVDKSVTNIFLRTLPNFMKINNQINNAFEAEIIDMKQGYMAGIPITYAYKNNVINTQLSDEQKKKEAVKMEHVTNEIRILARRLNLVDLNMETIKMTSICGTSSRLMYINTYGEISAININPWEVIYFYSEDGKEVLSAIRFYDVEQVEIKEDGSYSTVKKYKVDLYDRAFVTFYESDTNGDFVLVSQKPHLFGRVPLIEYVNNAERQGDFDKITALIDTYDKVLSDLASELEQFRLAYIALYGLKADKAKLDELRQTGMFEMTKDGKVEFVTKKVDIESVMALLNKIETNIVRFSKSVNFKDENFYGNLSGVAIKYKLTQLEEKAKILEVKFNAADDIMWQCLSNPLSAKGIAFDYTMIDRQWTRNIPNNMLEEARIQRELDGIVSTKTRFAIASFIQDADLEYNNYIDDRKLRQQLGIEAEATYAPGSGIKVDEVKSGGSTVKSTVNADNMDA